MAFSFYLGVSLLLSVLATTKCDLPDGVVHMECRDRYFMIAVDLSFTGDGPRFEAVDRTGVYPISEQYAATCGYTMIVFPLQGHMELRASYFSCHTDNTADEAFTFNFNLILNHEGEMTTYALNKTCSLSLPWSQREVTCEVNYMEVSVKNDIACPTGTKKDDWDAAVQASHASATSDWQVMFQKEGQELKPMNLSKAQEQHYAFDLTDGRLVFRTPYGQPDSLSTMVNGVPVEVVHATLFTRQGWVVLMVDLVAACSMHEGSYEAGYIMWETPAVLHPLLSGLHYTEVNIGVDGELVEQSVADERGYIVEKDNRTVQIVFPSKADGGYRKSFADDDLHEYYIFNLYLEQLLVDEDYVETRLRLQKTLATPLLPRPVFTENQTVVEAHTFTIYLGDVPEDVELAAVQLNDHDCTLPLPNTSIHTISEVVQPNTHGYILSVPFNDPVVIRQFSKEDAAMQYKLDINFTLTVQPENKSFNHFTSVMALTDVSPPTFEAVCLESGISFRLDHQPSDYLWDISIGSDSLTSELAEERGYIMTNDSQSLLLEVPLFTEGYEYKDFTLEGFFGTFEIFVQHHETSEVHNSAVKTCHFKTTELIVCSKDGRMTVAADLPMAATNEGVLVRANLISAYCEPKEANGTRVLFSFPLNSCGSTVKLLREYVTYENEIFFSRKSHATKNPSAPGIATDGVIIQCTYPVAGLYHLFSRYKFESDTPGVGRIVHPVHYTEGPQTTTVAPTTVLQTTQAFTTRRSKRPVSIRPAYLPPVKHIKVLSFQWNRAKKGPKRPSGVKAK